jgi:DNA-binding transcriptional ArsR family regulator
VVESIEADRIRVLDDPRSVAALLPPIRRRILENLLEPDSASGLAKRLGLPRQKVNYHLRELERRGLVELVEQRRRRGCVERVMRSTAQAFVVDPTLLGGLAADPRRLRDRFSSAYLVAVASHLIREVAKLGEGARAANKKLLTLTMESEVSFGTSADLRSYVEELAAALTRLAEKYHRPDLPGSRRLRLLVGGYPQPAVGSKTKRKKKTSPRAASRSALQPPV